MKEETGQKMLVAVTEEPYRQAIVLGHEGEGIGLEIDFTSRDIEDLGVYKTVPQAAGIYVWEGKLTYLEHDDEEAPDWDGAWRIATPFEVANFQKSAST